MPKYEKMTSLKNYKKARMKIWKKMWKRQKYDKMVFTPQMSNVKVKIIF